MNQLKKKAKIAAPAAPAEQQEEKGIWMDSYSSGGYQTQPSSGWGAPSGYMTAAEIMAGTNASVTTATDYVVNHAHSSQFAGFSSWLAASTGSTNAIIASTGTGSSTPTSGATYTVLTNWGGSGAPSTYLGGLSAGASSGVFTIPYDCEMSLGAQVTFSAAIPSGVEVTNENAGWRAAQIVLQRAITSPAGVTTTSQYPIAQFSCQPSANSAIDTVLPLFAQGDFLRGDQVWVQVAQNSGASLLVATDVRTQFRGDVIQVFGKPALVHAP
jgi:hypothetical protein